jgi:predicted transcriptional regulator
MARTPPKPTASELEIGYTGVLKLLQIMTAKGTVRRDESQRAHVYEAVRPADQTKRQLATDMLQRVFEGSASQLMMHALAGHRASAEEIDELRRILDAYEDDDNGKAV